MTAVSLAATGVFAADLWERTDALVRATPDAPETLDPAPPAPPHSSFTGERLDALLAQVRVVVSRPQVPGYDRECGPGDGCVFGTEWSDDTDAPDGHNGCDTRNDVLSAQLADVAYAPGSRDCDVVAGRLIDPYTGRTLSYETEGSEIHIDHLFPLAAAWDLGAHAWGPGLRASFANDTELELLAVSGNQNMAKGDSTPASWLPPRTAFRCEYVVRYLEVALAYGLAVTQADATTIAFVRDRACPAEGQSTTLTP
jgi:hypothetical protein